MVNALLRGLRGGDVQPGLDTELVGKLLAMQGRVSGFLAFEDAVPSALLC